MLDTAHNSLDHHVAAGRGDTVAPVQYSSVTGSVRRWIYRQARDEVALVAGGLRRLGVGKGDRICSSTVRWLVLEVSPQRCMMLRQHGCGPLAYGASVDRSRAHRYP